MAAKPKMTYARFTDTSRSLIRYHIESDEGLKIEHCTYDPNSEECKKILKKFGVETLEKNYIEFNKAEATTFNYFNIFKENISDITAIIDKRWHDLSAHSELLDGIQVEGPAVANIGIQEIKDIGNDQEKFFKLKLEIFELPEVKSSSNRDWKARMRKSTTTLELLATLYEVYSTVENEEGERQD